MYIFRFHDWQDTNIRMVSWAMFNASFSTWQKHHPSRTEYKMVSYRWQWQHVRYSHKRRRLFLRTA